MFQNTEMLPVLLMNYFRGREQKWYRVSTVVIFTSRRTEIAISAGEPKLQVLLAENALVQSCLERGDFITEDHKVLSEGCESRNHHRYAVVVQDLATLKTVPGIIYCT